MNDRLPTYDHFPPGSLVAKGVHMLQRLCNSSNRWNFKFGQIFAKMTWSWEDLECKTISTNCDLMRDPDFHDGDKLYVNYSYRTPLPFLSLVNYKLIPSWCLLTRIIKGCSLKVNMASQKSGLSTLDIHPLSQNNKCHVTLTTALTPMDFGINSHTDALPFHLETTINLLVD